MGKVPFLFESLMILNENCINNGFPNSDPNYEEFWIPVEDVTHIINRNPSVFAIPGSNQDGQGLPKIYSIDFGMLEETIVISGTLPDAYIGDPYVPTHNDLVRISRQWWHGFSLSGINTQGFNRLSLRTGPGPFDMQMYGFTFQNVQLSRRGGVLTWDYKMTLAIVKFPDEITKPGDYGWYATAAGG